jgi:thioredoxin reductase (NADPH)
MSAAGWCSELGLTVVLIDAAAKFGGLLYSIFNPVTNYLGVNTASGSELADILVKHLSTSEIQQVHGARVVTADLNEKTVVLRDGRVFSARTILIATGVSRRRLAVPGAEAFAGRGILLSGARDRQTVTGKRVAIVGGGDAALENALILSQHAERVVVVHRRSGFTARPDFVSDAGLRENVDFITNVVVVSIKGSDAVESIEVQDIASGERSHIPVDAVLIRIGAEPNTNLFRGQIDLDAAGYITVDTRCSTSACGVFAVGDVADRFSPTISGAVGMGATAARAIFDLLNG